MKLYEKKTPSGSSYMVAIPKDIATYLGLKKGDNMIVTLNINTNEIVVTKANKE